MLQVKPAWMSAWQKKDSAPTTSHTQTVEDLEDEVEHLKKKLKSADNRYFSLAKRNAFLESCSAWGLSYRMQGTVSSYAYAQCRASLEMTCQSMFLPHPELGEIEVPRVEPILNLHQKIPVASSHDVLCGMLDEAGVLVKRHINIFYAVAECHVMTKLKDIKGIPLVYGVYHKYNNSFVVNKLISPDNPWLSLVDILSSKNVFLSLCVSMWQTFILAVADIVDNIHSKGYLHNNILAQNVILDMSTLETTGDIQPYLCGFSLACHIEDARPLADKHTKEFGQKINHLPAEVCIGKTAASFQSDIYCFGQLLRELECSAKRYGVSDVPFWKKVAELCHYCVCKPLSCTPHGEVWIRKLRTHFSE